MFGKAINQVNELISTAIGCGGDFCVLGCDGTADNTGKLDRVISLFGLTRRKASTLVCLPDLHADELSHESLLKTGRWDNRDAVLHWASIQDRQRPCLPSACRSVWSSGRSLAWAAGGGGRPALAAPFHHNYGENWQSLQMTRLSRVYIASASPTNQLFQIDRYLVGFYCPMWFHIRSHNSCIHGAGTFLHSLKLITILCRTCRSRYSHWCGITPTWVTQRRCCSRWWHAKI